MLSNASKESGPCSKRYSRALRDVSQHVLFSYLVQTYDILVAADPMTDGGNLQWHRQVSRAIEKGLHITLRPDHTGASAYSNAA